jgi:hypothetical protein
MRLFALISTVVCFLDAFLVWTSPSGYSIAQIYITTPDNIFVVSSGEELQYSTLALVWINEDTVKFRTTRELESICFELTPNPVFLPEVYHADP